MDHHQQKSVRFRFSYTLLHAISVRFSFFLSHHRASFSIIWTKNLQQTNNLYKKQEWIISAVIANQNHRRHRRRQKQKSQKERATSIIPEVPKQ